MMLKYINASQLGLYQTQILSVESDLAVPNIRRLSLMCEYQAT